MQFETWLINHEVAVRLGCFFAVLLTMMALEIRIPRRQLIIPRERRWPNNLGLVVFNSLLLRLLFPTAAAGMAAYSEQEKLGLFNQLAVAHWIVVVICIIALDMVIYWQHVMFHRFPLLWRLHKVHHADLDYDVTTGSRFHPIEIVLSMLIKFATILILGIPMVAVILFEIILNAMAMFNHSNIRLPHTWDALLRKLIVTPDMHRVHHSRITTETHSNFGFNLSVWDRLFATYRAQPSAGHDHIAIGLPNYDNPTEVVALKGLLIMPFQNNN